MRTSDPGPPEDGTPRGKMQLWCNYDEGKVGLRIGAITTLLTPDEARARADDLEDEFGGTGVGEDEETQAFISDLRERADEVERRVGDDD